MYRLLDPDTTPDGVNDQYFGAIDRDPPESLRWQQNSIGTKLVIQSKIIKLKD
jgi:hypothetical protein